MGIPLETVMDLLAQEQDRYRDRKTLVKAVRRKLHNITAPYLENLDYGQASAWVGALPDETPEQLLKETCSRILSTHASTRERLPFLEIFYDRIFKETGVPASILDLASGLNPFSFPWMGLPISCRFHAYDIHAPRVALINQFFRKVGLEPLAEVRDVLISPPTLPTDIAFLFKEAHRMEKRKPGCSRPFWETLQVRTLAVSLPSADLSGDHDLTDRHRSLVMQILEGTSWAVKELAFENELVFLIDKGERLTWHEPA